MGFKDLNIITDPIIFKVHVILIFFIFCYDTDVKIRNFFFIIYQLETNVESVRVYRNRKARLIRYELVS